MFVDCFHRKMFVLLKLDDCPASTMSKEVVAAVAADIDRESQCIVVMMPSNFASDLWEFHFLVLNSL